MSVTIELSYPPAGLSPNARLHPAAKAALVKRYREEARVLAWSARWDTKCGILKPPVRAQATFYVHEHRPRDGDNLNAMLKAAWDGFVTAELLAGDTAEDLIIEPPHVNITERDKRRRVLIRLTPAP
jgi:crossover junction endodeoxyribonuclease RusA